MVWAANDQGSGCCLPFFKAIICCFIFLRTFPAMTSATTARMVEHCHVSKLSRALLGIVAPPKTQGGKWREIQPHQYSKAPQLTGPDINLQPA